MEVQANPRPQSERPVFHLQTMLRTVSFRHDVIPQVIPTGVFDEPTLEAVMVFQREFHPPVTGVVDTGTWEAIVALYRQSLQELAPPFPVHGYPSGDHTIEEGEESVHLFLIQAMFKALASILDGVEDAEVTGAHDAATSRNVCWLHQSSGLPSSGTITRETWNALARLYRIFVSYAQTPWVSRKELLRPGQP